MVPLYTMGNETKRDKARRDEMMSYESYDDEASFSNVLDYAFRLLAFL